MNFMEKLTDQHKFELSLFAREKGRTPGEVKRSQAILMLTEGISETIIFELTGLKRPTIVKTRKKYLKNGISALESTKKNKQPRSLLTKNERNEIAEILHGKTPRNYGWECDYWTPAILGKVILELYGVKYKSKTSLYLIFKQSKFSFHKPEKIYEKRNQKAIDQWRQENDKVIKEALNDAQTVVLVEDEMIVTSQTTLQKIWLPQNASVNITCSNTRKRKSFYGFLDIKTGQEIAFKADKQTSEISAKLLKKVLRMYHGKKVLLLWDNAPWHRGAHMKDFLATCSDFHIINFPPYAPDENPQEHVWKAARAHVTHNTFIQDIEIVSRQILTYLNSSIFKYTFFGFTASSNC
jgi:transposase